MGYDSIEVSKEWGAFLDTSIPSSKPSYGEKSLKKKDGVQNRTVSKI